MIPFNKPYLFGDELSYIADAHGLGHLSGNGMYTNLCSEWLKEYGKSPEVLLTHSCTAALEMAAILADIRIGDEIIMPSFTFVSTANAFALRGGVPVFVDIKADTLNIDEALIEPAITERTKAIVVVHYAGGSCNMDAIMKIAALHNLLVIEDAAQAIGATYNRQPLGTFGDLGCLSFHETKNVSSGEGGAIFINNENLSERARIIREKGTNRYQYSKGLVDKYTWVDIGSSYLPNELTAAFLYAQLQNLDFITMTRLTIWDIYNTALGSETDSAKWITPSFEDGAKQNGHMYHLRLRSKQDRDAFIEHMGRHNIHCTFHYVPLHSSPFGIKASRHNGSMDVTTKASDTLVRLPIWIGLDEHLESIIVAAKSYLPTPV